MNSHLVDGIKFKIDYNGDCKTKQAHTLYDLLAIINESFEDIRGKNFNIEYNSNGDRVKVIKNTDF